MAILLSSWPSSLIAVAIVGAIEGAVLLWAMVQRPLAGAELARTLAAFYVLGLCAAVPTVVFAETSAPAIAKLVAILTVQVHLPF